MSDYEPVDTGEAFIPDAQWMRDLAAACDEFNAALEDAEALERWISREWGPE